MDGEIFQVLGHIFATKVKCESVTSQKVCGHCLLSSHQDFSFINHLGFFHPRWNEEKEKGYHRLAEPKSCLQINKLINDLTDYRKVAETIFFSFSNLFTWFHNRLVTTRHAMTTIALVKPQDLHLCCFIMFHISHCQGWFMHSAMWDTVCCPLKNKYFSSGVYNMDCNQC